jgi:hypothetical protein
MPFLWTGELGAHLPRRGNAFQSLIRALHAGAGEGGVQESAELIDRRTGEPREVDIVLDVSLAGYSIRISIECTATKAPADVTWVEKMVAKHADLPTDKLVLVSSNGFTAQALKKALSYNAVPLQLDELSDHPWARIIGNRKELTFRAVYSRSFLVTHPRGVEAPEGEMLFRDDLLVRPNIQMSVGTLIDTLMSNKSVLEAAINVANETTGDGCEVYLPIEPGIKLQSNAGPTAAIEQLTMVFLQYRIEERVPLRSARFRGAPVAFGGIRSKGREVDLAFVQREDGSIAATLTERRKGESPTVLDLNDGLLRLKPASDDDMIRLLTGSEPVWV